MPTTHRARHRTAVAALIGTFLLMLVPVVPVAADNTVQTLPFAQNWTDTNQITANDNWSGVPGIRRLPRPGHHASLRGPIRRRS